MKKKRGLSLNHLPSSSYECYYVLYHLSCCRDVPKKRLIYPGKTAPKKNKKKKLVSKLEDAHEDEEMGDKEEEDEKEPNETQEDMESEKVIRKSTRTSVIVRQAERDALRAAIQATTKVFFSCALAISTNGYTKV